MKCQTVLRRLCLSALAVFLGFPAFAPPLDAADANADGRVYELRTYYANEGKLDALHARFRDHTVSLFNKHGMTNIAYWVPKQGDGSTLVYLMAYPDRKARDASWKAFMDDPDWKAAYAASTADGKLVKKVDSVFLKPTAWSPTVKLAENEPPRLFELRQYTTNEGKLGALHARFRDHTIDLFGQHGMTNLWYFEVLPEQKKGAPSSTSTLIYFLAHTDEAARTASFDGFRSDPKWIAARDASEADGKILIEGGVQSTLLVPTDYSPMK